MKKIIYLLALFFLVCNIGFAQGVIYQTTTPNAVVIPGMTNPTGITSLNPCNPNWIFNDWVHGIYYACIGLSAANPVWTQIASYSFSFGNNIVSINYSTSNGSVSIPLAYYMIAPSGDLVIGTASSTNTIHLEVGLNSPDSMAITSTGITSNVVHTMPASPITPNQNNFFLTTLGVVPNPYAGNLYPKCNAVHNYNCVM
jgi:hypothetical protein